MCTDAATGARVRLLRRASHDTQEEKQSRRIAIMTAVAAAVAATAVTEARGGEPLYDHFASIWGSLPFIES